MGTYGTNQPTDDFVWKDLMFCLFIVVFDHFVGQRLKRVREKGLVTENFHCKQSHRISSCAEKKCLKMKVKNTYSRKKQEKPRTNTKTNVVNINLVFLSVSISNNNSSQGNQTKPDSSKSDSGELFDKLVKGPIYNVNNQSTFSLSEYSQKFFSQRQDTATFYRSDEALSISTEISNNLFKDSKDSRGYSPIWSSPPSYCKVKNKLVKMKKVHKITISKKTYQSNCVQKKRPIVRKYNKPLPMVKPDDNKSVSCTSSTPSRSDALPSKDIWADTYFSPILPASLDISDCHKDMHTSGEYEKNERPNAVLSMTGLLEGFGNLGIQTPYNKKFGVVADDKVTEKELFDYESPICGVLVSRQREVRNQEYCSVSCNSLSQYESGEEHRKLKIDLLAVADEREKSSKSSEDSSTSCNVSTPRRKGTEEEDCEELASELLSTPFLGFEDNSAEAPSDSSSTKALTNSKNTPHNKQRLSPSRVSSISKEEIKSEHEEKTDSGDISSIKSTSSASSPNRNLESENLTKNTEECCAKDYLNCSLPITEHKNEQHHLENKNGEGNGIVSNESTHENSVEESQVFVPKPLCNITNLSSIISKNDAKEIRKQSFPFNKENKRMIHYSLRDRLSSYPSTMELNETFVKINLEAGKKWRRSLLRQRQQEPKFDKRVTLTSDTLLRLIKESNFASGLANRTNLTCNNTTRITDSFLEEAETKNNLSVCNGSPGLNLTFSRLNNVHTRRRRNYIFNMNEIPEEITEPSVENVDNPQESNEAQCREDAVVELGSESVCETSVNQTNLYETPPFLKMNPEALSAITDRKRSRRCQQSLGSSVVWEEEEHNVTPDEESKLYMSCCSWLALEDEIENLKNQDVEFIGKVGFLLQCGQQAPISFAEAFPEQVLRSGKKIGEGVFGEVFMLDRPGEGRSVIKIIPIEGAQMVNGAVQKRYEEVLSELIITEELSLLRTNSYNCTSGFCELKGKFYLQGEYSPHLLRLWHEFDQEKCSENECPDMFGTDQLYLVLELAHAGEPVESFSFKNTQQALGVFLQTTFSLAVAESAADFEHRDLHIGNVLVQTTSERYISFVLNGTRFESPTYETKATIIDYTLSRISFKDDVLYLDLEQDPELFTAEGDYQFDIYRDMRADLSHNWRDHQPKTNIRWLHYLIDKLTDKIKYKQKKNTKLFKEFMDKMVILKDMVMGFDSATDLALHLVHFHSQTSTLMRSEEER